MRKVYRVCSSQPDCLLCHLRNMSKNLCKDLVIYDLDGTLVDSAVTVTTVLNVLRRKQSKAFVRRACPAIDVIGWSS